MNLELIRDAFMNCTVQNKEIVFNKNYTDEQLWEIYIKFSEDLLDYKIPHYRVVGIKCSSGVKLDSVIKVNSNYGISMVELSLKCREIIPSEIGPYVPEYTRKSEGGANGIIMTDAELGQLRYEHNCEWFVEDSNEISTDTLRYGGAIAYHMERDGQEGFLADKVPFLIKDVTLCNTYSSFEDNCETVFFYMKGTGTKDYSELFKLFDKRERIFPVRAVYDLCSYITCRIPGFSPTSRNNCLELEYLRDIDENVFTKILREYGEGLGE